MDTSIVLHANDKEDTLYSFNLAEYLNLWKPNARFHKCLLKYNGSSDKERNFTVLVQHKMFAFSCMHWIPC